MFIKSVTCVPVGYTFISKSTHHQRNRKRTFFGILIFHITIDKESLKEVWNKYFKGQFSYKALKEQFVPNEESNLKPIKYET